AVVGAFAGAVVEIADRRLQRLGQLPQAGGRDAVGAALVLLNLLEPYADAIAQLLLGQAQQAATAAQATTQVQVDLGGHDDTPVFLGLCRIGTDRGACRKPRAVFAPKARDATRRPPAH